CPDACPDCAERRRGSLAPTLFLERELDPFRLFFALVLRIFSRFVILSREQPVPTLCLSRCASASTWSVVCARCSLAMPPRQVLRALYLPTNGCTFSLPGSKKEGLMMCMDYPHRRVVAVSTRRCG